MTASGRMPGLIDADHPREGEREPAHVDAGAHRQRQGDDQREEGEDGWAHE